MPATTYKTVKGSIDLIFDKFKKIDRSTLKSVTGLDYKTLKKINDGGEVSLQKIGKLADFFSIDDYFDLINTGFHEDINPVINFSHEPYYKADSITNLDLPLSFFNSRLEDLEANIIKANRIRWVFDQNIVFDDITIDLLKKLNQYFDDYLKVINEFKNLQSNSASNNSELSKNETDVINDRYFEDFSIDAQLALEKKRPKGLTFEKNFINKLTSHLIEKGFILYFADYNFWNSEFDDGGPYRQMDRMNFWSTPISTFFISNRYVEFLEVNAGRNYVQNESQIASYMMERKVSVIVNGEEYDENSFDWSEVT